MKFFTAYSVLVVMGSGATPPENAEAAIESHMATLRKRHRNLTEAQLRVMAGENLYGHLPETKFSMPAYERADWRRLSPIEIVRLTYSENPGGKNAELVPRIVRRLEKGQHLVDSEWIVKQLSYLRRQAKDARWEEYQRFTRT